MTENYTVTPEGVQLLSKAPYRYQTTPTELPHCNAAKGQ